MALMSPPGGGDGTSVMSGCVGVCGVASLLAEPGDPAQPIRLTSRALSNDDLFGRFRDLFLMLSIRIVQILMLVFLCQYCGLAMTT